MVAIVAHIGSIAVTIGYLIPCRSTVDGSGHILFIAVRSPQWLLALTTIINSPIVGSCTILIHLRDSVVTDRMKAAAVAVVVAAATAAVAAAVVAAAVVKAGGVFL